MTSQPSPSHESEEPRRVTILASTADWGGTEEVTLGLLRTLERRGHATSVVDLRLPVYEPALRAAGLRTQYRHVSLGERLNALSPDAYARLLSELGTDICVLTKGAFSVRDRHVDEGARRAARRYVIIEHLVAGPMRAAPPMVFGVPMTLNPAWYRHRRRGRAHLAAGDVVVCVSFAVKARLSAEFGADWRGVVVHNGVDTEAFTFTREARAAVRHEWGVPEDAFLFGFMGRLAHVKAPDVALSQFSEIRSNMGRSAFLVLAGDGPERAALEERARSLGLAHNVHFPGWIGRPARAGVLSAFDTFLLPSRAEGLPLALLEAMAVERPCIGCDVGGVGEALSTPQVGWLVPAGDDAAFGRAMLHCMTTDTTERERMGAEARAHVERNFHRARQLERLTDVVLGERHRPAARTD